MRTFNPLQRLILAGRIGAERMTGTPPVGAQQTMESSEGPIVAVGGVRSLRGYYDDRFLGPGKLVGGVEARYGLLWAPRLLEVKLFAFYDAGRVLVRGNRFGSRAMACTRRWAAASGWLCCAIRCWCSRWARAGEGSQFSFADELELTDLADLHSSFFQLGDIGIERHRLLSVGVHPPCR